MFYFFVKNKNLSGIQVENFNKQSEMDNPIEVNWVNNHPNILNENEKFKEHFFAQLKKLGVKL